MDDSDQDFVDLCSKLLKRVRKKPAEPRQARKAEQQPSSQASDGDKKRRNNNRRDGDGGSAKCAGTQPACTGAEAKEPVICGRTGYDSGDAGSSGVSAAAAAGLKAERGLRAKDKVLDRMQQFKRASPQRMVRKDKSQATDHERDCAAPPPLLQRHDSFSSGLHLDTDEALALRLQQELDRDAAAAVPTVDLEDGGLFFCQICHKDLSHMSPEGRTQHLNRCLDKSEESAPAPSPPPPPPRPGVPDCPICGKKFKSQKSRSTHLKRCSTDMGVPPAVLLQALQRQSEETQNVPAANTTETGGTKRKGPTMPGVQARKKPRKKAEPMDEDTMVALALSTSLLNQERESERLLQTETAASDVAGTPVLKWRPEAGKGRGKRKKGAIPRPPPLLLIQDAEVALTRLQERVSALLLRSRPSSPPTPTRCPSSLPGWKGAAPLWQMSALLRGGSTCLSDFYTPELREFITPWESSTIDAASSNTVNKPESSVQPTSEGTPVTVAKASNLLSSSQTAASSPAPSTPGTGQLPVSSQTLRDLMELAEDGMTMTQCGYTASDKSACPTANLHLSGFLLEESEEQADLCVSGFLPETTHTDDSKDRARRTTYQPGADKNRGQSVALSRLSSDLSSMVNNPQLSDVQLQVDSGEVYFAHSFMALARCPLLAEMVHESGFGVQEEGMPAAQRVLISDVPGQAVFALLQYIYTAHCSIPGSLRPHVLELASRFDLQELQQLCELHQEAATLGEEEDYTNVNNETDQAFVELLRSMWNEEDEDNEGTDTDEGRDEEKGLKEDHRADDLTAVEREIGEEKVNEEELEEIYEFAATQRKREEEKDSVDEEEEEEVVDEEDDAEEVFTKPTEPRRSSAGFSNKNLQPNSLIEQDPSLDRSYSRLFSDSWGVYNEEDPSYLPSTSGQPKTCRPQSQKHQSLHKSSLERSGRTLLQSSASVVHDLSLSPPPNTSNLPVPGRSPGQVGDWGTDAADLDEPKESLHLKQESQGPRSICVPLSPDSPQIKKEPELIVLSDSSEGMEVVLSSRSPSPHSPHVVQKQQSYTQIIPQPILKSDEHTQDHKKFRSLEFSPDDRSAAVNKCDQSPVYCSPEVSWLIPSTPLQHRRSMTSSSSTQTKSSMCRTQLFPKGDPSSLSVFSSPALPYTPQTSESPTRVSAHSGPTEGSAPRLKHPSSSSLELNLSPKGTSSCEVKKEFAAPPSRCKRTYPSNSFSSKQDTPLHLQPHPYSSTPLHTEIHQPHSLLAASPLHISLDKQTSASQGKDSASSDSPDKTELGSFHLSPLSDPSGPPSSSSHRVLQSSQRHSDDPHQSPEFKMRGIKDEERETECQNKDRGDDGEQEEVKAESGVAEVAESSFRQSFTAMDEPPIAFNDSWGLDACVDANPGCFSLKLEDSRGSSQQEHSPGEQKTTRSPSSTDCQPSPSTHNARLLNGHGKGVTTHSSQPGTSEQAHAGPSPPDPTTRTTPQISSSLLDSKIWDSWEEEKEEEAPPLSQRVNPPAHFRTPASSHNKRRRTLVPITPMPHYSDMDTPELKNKLNRFGVRPLPKRQMVLKLKEIHQYTHQLTSSDSEDEGCTSAGRAAPMKPPPTNSVAAGNRPLSSAQTVKFKEPLALAATSPLKHNREEEGELLSASQGSNTSSTAASEESERSNPELYVTSDSDSDDSDITASQVATRLQDRLQAVRSFILSDPQLYTQILQYQPLVLSQLQQQLKAAGIRLGAAKLMDYLDSQCITFTTAKPGRPAPSRRRGKKSGKVAKAAGDSGASRKRGVTTMI